MKNLQHLFENNLNWSQGVTAKDPKFFQVLSKQQKPKYLWIGCADSRVPANEIVGLLPGELFVHRNVANLVIHTDLNCLSVIQYAVDVLQVEHIIVCGHYGCGGVAAALKSERLGLIDAWLQHIKDVRGKHRALLNRVGKFHAKQDKLCELNIIEQVRNVCNSTIVQDAWQRGQELTVHGWVYAIQDGILRNLGLEVSDAGELKHSYAHAIKQLS